MLFIKLLIPEQVVSSFEADLVEMYRQYPRKVHRFMRKRYPLRNHLWAQDSLARGFENVLALLYIYIVWSDLYFYI